MIHTEVHLMCGIHMNRGTRTPVKEETVTAVLPTSVTPCILLKPCKAMYTVQFPYLETCGVRKLGKTKGEGGTWHEDSSRFMAVDVSEQYQSQIHRPLQR
jgi:hypothetical protein